MTERTAFEARIEKRQAVNTAEAAGQVADSLNVRKELMAKVHAGTMTLAEAQSKLKKIQHGAKAAGKVTRAQAFNGG